MNNVALKSRDLAESSAADGQPHPQLATPLSLGIAPIVFSSDTFQLGRLAPENQESIKELRRQHGKTHAFRFDSRNKTIANIALAPGVLPMGDVAEVPVTENLLLLAEGIENQLRGWFSRSRTILRPSHPLVCLGSRDRLLSIALQEAGVQTPDRRVEVVAKWTFDLRVIAPANPEHPRWLGLIADVGTSNVIDIPVSELIQQGFNPIGCYVGTPSTPTDAAPASRLRLLGQVAHVEADHLILDDVRSEADTNRVAAGDVFLEARFENLEAVLKVLYPGVATEALKKLRRIRAPYLSGDRKLEKIRHTIGNLNKSLKSADEKALRLTFGDGLNVTFGALLDQLDARFPRIIETTRPAMLFGPSGHDQASQPDQGVRRFGPFQYAHNPTNDPVIAVLCDKHARGRMDQFAKLLRDGLDEDHGRFSGGLVGKFRLTSVRFQFAEIDGDSAESYDSAARHVLDELPQTPALAIVQVRGAHRQRTSDQNPYYVAKARFMKAGVPVQAVRLETVEAERGRAYSLNNLALATYAKIGGVPWVISTRGVATHELVIGIGCTEIGSRLGERSRYVGITTLFQGDGRYLVWETTREANFEDYPEALLVSLRKSIRFVRDQNKWQDGDPVRLVFHVYKPLKRQEIAAVEGARQRDTQRPSCRIRFSRLVP